MQRGRGSIGCAWLEPFDVDTELKDEIGLDRVQGRSGAGGQTLTGINLRI